MADRKCAQGSQETHSIPGSPCTLRCTCLARSGECNEERSCARDKPTGNPRHGGSNQGYGRRKFSERAPLEGYVSRPARRCLPGGSNTMPNLVATQRKSQRCADSRHRLSAQRGHQSPQWVARHGRHIVKISGTRPFRPSSSPRITSKLTPRIVGVTGATVTCLSSGARCCP